MPFNVIVARQCSVCGAAVPIWGKYDHIHKVHPDIPITRGYAADGKRRRVYQCLICQEKSSGVESRLKHIKAKHPQVSFPQRSLIPVVTDQCVLDRHPSGVCDYCGITIDPKAKVSHLQGFHKIPIIHISRDAETRQSRYQCGVCQIVVGSISAYQQHDCLGTSHPTKQLVANVAPQVPGIAFVDKLIERLKTIEDLKVKLRELNELLSVADRPCIRSGEIQ